ncbi:MAG: ornithine carbamoyltransferase [Acidobacteriota bacterium]
MTRKTHFEPSPRLQATDRLSVPDLISISYLTVEDIQLIFETAERIKQRPGDYTTALSGKTLALIFEKPSLRTRVTFDVGMTSMGGHAVFLDHSDAKLGERESIKDVARNLERWLHGIVARTYKNRSVAELAEHADIPVINGLTDLLHPCQALTDYFTVREKLGGLKGIKFSYVGDGNNTCHSLIDGAAKLGVKLFIATPEGFEPNHRIVSEAEKAARETGAEIRILNDPAEAVKDASVVYTDVWASMGQEAEAEDRAGLFADYRVDSELMSHARKDAFFMHCLPAHRGYEVAPSVIDSPQSIVYDQAENRLHVQKAILFLLMSDSSEGTH